LLDLCEPWDLRARCGEAELDAETMQKSCWREQSRLCAAPRGGDQLRRLTAGNRRSAPPLRPHQGEQLRFFKRKHILSGRVGLGQSRQPLTTGPQTNVLFNGVRHVSHRGGVLTYTPGHQASFATSIVNLITPIVVFMDLKLVELASCVICSSSVYDPI
jgi:hypothetical protein